MGDVTVVDASGAIETELIDLTDVLLAELLTGELGSGALDGVIRRFIAPSADPPQDVSAFGSFVGGSAPTTAEVA